MGFIKEFKEFISRGNVVDMAVGVVVGGAFRSIIDSLVADIIMPAISLVTGKIDIAKLAVTIPNPTNPDAPISLAYGNFLQQIVNFIIIAFTIFCVVKGINTMHEKLSKSQDEVAEVCAPTTEELLTEIRDLIKKD